MEPTSFNVGDLASSNAWKPVELLQWSRRLSTSETMTWSWWMRRRTCFNGADVFQRRRPPRPRFQARALRSFNGADVFQRRRQSNFRKEPNGRLLLQWSRRLSTSETAMNPEYSAQAHRASMEPTSFNVGDRAVRHAELASPAVASMEPTSFNVGDSEYLTVTISVDLLQWSRRLSTSETVGPIGRQRNQLRLQWSRRLSTSETRPSPVQRSQILRFNGADVFQRRRR